MVAGFLFLGISGFVVRGWCGRIESRRAAGTWPPGGGDTREMGWGAFIWLGIHVVRAHVSRLPVTLSVRMAVHSPRPPHLPPARAFNAPRPLAVIAPMTIRQKEDKPESGPDGSEKSESILRLCGV